MTEDPAVLADNILDMKKIIVAIVLIFIILGLGIFCIFKYLNTTGNNNAAQQFSSETKNFSEESTQYNYKVNADYPEFSGLQNTDAQNKINQDAKNFVTSIADKFKEDSKTNCDFSNLPGPKPEWTCELFIALDGFNLVNNKVLSIEIEYYQFTGGAHGGTTYEFLNYNNDNGERINWRDVFKQNSDYLKIISDYSKNNLDQQLLKPSEPLSDSNWIERGTAPTSENYNTNVGFNSDGLAIVFQQYQVAAYAAGPQVVTVPYSQLESVIDPAGLLR